MHSISPLWRPQKAVSRLHHQTLVTRLPAKQDIIYDEMARCTMGNNSLTKLMQGCVIFTGALVNLETLHCPPMQRGQIR